MQEEKWIIITKKVDTKYNCCSPPLMCVGLVISWSNFSLARNLGRREVLSTSFLYIHRSLPTKGTC